MSLFSLYDYSFYDLIHHFYTEEAVVKNYEFKREKAKTLQKKLNLERWWSVCQLVNFSLQDWLNLSDTLQLAVYMLAEETIEAKNKAYSDEKRQREMEMAINAAHLKFPNQISSSIERYLR